MKYARNPVFADLGTCFCHWGGAVPPQLLEGFWLKLFCAGSCVITESEAIPHTASLCLCYSALECISPRG